MALYVSFDDGNDPTYGQAENMSLVEVDDVESPIDSKTAVRVPMLPRTGDEVVKFASMLGWDAAIDNDGQIILCTGIIVQE
jgi:hypothetical protein